MPHAAVPRRPRACYCSNMRRREFITVLGGVALAWPLGARAQQSRRRIGVLMAFDENDPQIRGWLSNFTQGLAELGWTEGRTVRLEVRWAAGSVDRMRTFAKELVELQPDVIVASTTPVTAALQRDTSTIPIVFVLVSDPVGAGFVAGLPRPSGNITGFTNIEGPRLGASSWRCSKRLRPPSDGWQSCSTPTRRLVAEHFSRAHSKPLPDR